MSLVSTAVCPAAPAPSRRICEREKVLHLTFFSPCRRTAFMTIRAFLPAMPQQRPRSRPTRLCPAASVRVRRDDLLSHLLGLIMPGIHHPEGR